MNEDDEALRRKEVDRAHRAKQIFEDPLFEEAVQAVNDGIWQTFVTSPIDDDGMRLRARLQLDCLDSVVKQLRNHIETGKLAEQQLSLKERMLKVVR